MPSPPDLPSPLLHGLAGPRDTSRVLELLHQLGATPHLLTHAALVLPGRSIIAWRSRTPGRLLAAALVSANHHTATLSFLGTSHQGPALRDLAAWVPIWNQPARGVRVLRATRDVPRRALGHRWRPSRDGFRYHFRPGDQAASCPLCRRLRISRRDQRCHPGLVCPDCDARATDRAGTPPPILDDHAVTRVVIDGAPCHRHFCFGGWITTLDPSSAPPQR